MASASWSLGDAPIVHNQPIRFLIIVHAVHARNRLEQRVLTKRSVEIHDLLDRSVEASQEHVAHDEDRERITRFAEARDEFLSLVLRGVMANEAFVIFA